MRKERGDIWPFERKREGEKRKGRRNLEYVEEGERTRDGRRRVGWVWDGFW